MSTFTLMDRFFDDVWSAQAPRHWREGTVLTPACDVEESDDHFLLSLEMPGIPKDQLQIEARGNQLVISGEKKFERKSGEKGSVYSERRFGRVERSFTLPTGVDLGQVEANYQDGVLHIMVPKAVSAKPRQIKITDGKESGFFAKLLGQPKTAEPKTDQVA